MPKMEMGGLGVERTPAKELDKKKEEKTKLERERDAAFPNLAPLFTELHQKDTELNSTLYSVMAAKEDSGLKEAARVTKDFAVEMVPGVRSVRKAGSILSRILAAGTSLGAQWMPYQPTTLDDVKDSVNAYVELRKLAGPEGERQIMEAQAELVQAQFDLNKAASALPLDKQAGLLKLQSAIQEVAAQIENLQKKV